MRSLNGGAEVVEVTASAKLSFERKHKKPIDAEIRSGMVEPLYDVVHRALRITKADDTPEDFDEWLAGVSDLVILPGDAFGYFLAVCHDLSADETEHTADLVRSIAELKRANAELPEPDLPTGGDPTPQQDGSPAQSSGRGSARTSSTPSKRKTRTSSKASS